MRESTNFDLQLYDGSDLFNPLSVENVNMESIDEQMKVNADYSVPKATAIKAGTVHNITRTNKDASMFHFTATSEYTAGETFTVDGNIVSVETSSGDPLQTGAFVIGAEVLCCLVGSIMTVFSSAGVDLSNVNATTLEGHSADYFATDQALSVTNAAAVSAGEMALTNKNRLDVIESTGFTRTTLISKISATGTYNLSDDISTYKMLMVQFYRPDMDMYSPYIPISTELNLQTMLMFLRYTGESSSNTVSSSANVVAYFPSNTTFTVKTYGKPVESNFTLYGLK